MGSDIHLHTEVKIQGKWYHYGSPRIESDYRLFSLLANVRNSYNIKPISKPRGLPNDISFLTQFIYNSEKDDSHSMSYIASKEMIIIAQWWKKHNKNFMESEFGYLVGRDWTEFETHPEDQIEGIEDVRFVFWFDN